MFKCDKCGLCCQNLHLNPLYLDLDSGNGVCVHFDDETHLCKIYENRPLKCNVDQLYKVCFSNTLTREEYYQLNCESCRKLKENRED